MCHRYFRLVSILCFFSSILSAKIPHDKNHYLSSLGTKQWTKQMLEKYKELSWLADKQVSITHDYSANSKDSYSKDLYGKQYIEFDRTMLSLEVLLRLRRGSNADYKWLIQKQNKSLSLTEQSFKEIHQFIKLKEKRTSSQILELAVVLGDMGKTKKARHLAYELSRFFPDQDEFYNQIIKSKPQIFPSLKKYLGPSERLILQQGSHLLNFGHVSHLEGNEHMFSVLKKSKLITKKTGLKAFDFEYIAHICDVAGAAGHVSYKGSLTLTEATYQKLKNVYQAALTLKNKSPKQALIYYLRLTAKLLKRPFSLNVKNQIILRLASMLRLYNKEQVDTVENSLNQLTPKNYTIILEMLSFDALRPPIKIPTYIPAVLVNLSKNKNLGKTANARIHQAIVLGAPAIARSLKYATKRPIFKSGKLTLNFNPMAAQAKKIQLRNVFIKGSVRIKENGEIYLSR